MSDMKQGASPSQVQSANGLVASASDPRRAVFNFHAPPYGLTQASHEFPVVRVVLKRIFTKVQRLAGM